MNIAIKRVETYYDGHAPRYEAKFRVPLSFGFKRMEEDGILKFLRHHLPENGRLLELGCGTGLFTIPVARWGGRITAVDISTKMIAEIREKVAREGLENIAVLKADVETLEGLEAQDAVYGIGLLEYLDSPEQAVRQAASLLRPGGVAVFTGPTRSLSGLAYVASSLVRKRMWMNLFSRRGLAGLLASAGLEPLEVRPVGFHLPLMSPLTCIVAGKKPIRD